MNWTNIRIEPATMVLPQCAMSDPIPARPGWYGNEFERCGASASSLVTRTSDVSGKTYTDPMCERHALSWKKAQERST
jgi:hypothetical protein